MHYVKFLNEKLLTFVRAGYVNNDGALMKKSGSIGFRYQKIAGNDLLGLGSIGVSRIRVYLAQGLKIKKLLSYFTDFN